MIEQYKKMLCESMHRLALQALEDSPLKDSPLASMAIIESLNSSAKYFENVLIDKKDELVLTELEIKDLVKNSYTEVYDSLLD